VARLNHHSGVSFLLNWRCRQFALTPEETMNPADAAFVRQALQALRQALTAPAWSEVQRALLALERVELAQPRAAEPMT
jgi:hypothetical protein